MKLDDIKKQIEELANDPCADPREIEALRALAETVGDLEEQVEDLRKKVS